MRPRCALSKVEVLRDIFSHGSAPRGGERASARGINKERNGAERIR